MAINRICGQGNPESSYHQHAVFFLSGSFCYCFSRVFLASNMAPTGPLTKALRMWRAASLVKAFGSIRLFGLDEDDLVSVVECGEHEMFMGFVRGGWRRRSSDSVGAKSRLLGEPTGVVRTAAGSLDGKGIVGCSIGHSLGDGGVGRRWS